MSPAASAAVGPESPSKTPPRSPSTEETPLLASQVEESRDVHEEDALPVQPETEAKRTKGWWFWRIFWTILAALVLAVFIKGWVDARDVDVRFSPCYHCLMPKS